MHTKEELMGIATKLVADELRRAIEKHGPMPDHLHTFWGILDEETTEVQQEIFKKVPDLNNLACEAAQVAAVAIKGLVDIILPRLYTQLETKYAGNDNDITSDRGHSREISSAPTQQDHLVFRSVADLEGSDNQDADGEDGFEWNEGGGLQS